MTAGPKPPRGAVIINLDLLERRIPDGEPIEMPDPTQDGYAVASWGGITFAAFVAAAVPESAEAAG